MVHENSGELRGVKQYKVKGTHIFQARKWIDEHLGEGSFFELARDLSSGGVDWPGPILAGSWYDVDPLQEVLAAASARTRKTVENIVTEIAVMNARNDLVSVYRAFLRVSGPHLTLGATHKLWSNYVAFGEARAVQNEFGTFVGECHGIPKKLIPWACGCWGGFIPTAIEISGGKRCVWDISFKGRMESSDLWMLRLSAKYS